MTENAVGMDKLRAWLCVAAAAGMIAINILSAKGWLSGVTPQAVAALYPTEVTPAGYSFTIWVLIYLGLAAFALYQVLPTRLAAFRGSRTFFILSCALNCGWLFMWHQGRVAICFAIIILLLLSVMIIIARHSGPATLREYWASKAPFELYGGWLTAMAAVNFAAMLAYLNVRLSETVDLLLSIFLILLVAVIGVLVRIRFRAFLFPLAIAWAAAGIGIGQSGKTLIVVASTVALIAGLIASLSVIVTLPTYHPELPTDQDEGR